jgi:hypothetical protein
MVGARLKEANRHLQLSVEDVGGMSRLLEILSSMRDFAASDGALA